MSDTIWGEYMEEQQEQLIAEMFGVPDEWAREAMSKVGTEIKKIRRYLKKKEKREHSKAGLCKLCGRKLTDPDSIKRGYGSECYNKVMSEIINIDFEV